MKYALIAFLLVSGSAYADTTVCQQIGNFTYCTTTPSPQLTVTPMAPVYTPPAPPRTVVCQKIGNFTYCS